MDIEKKIVEEILTRLIGIGDRVIRLEERLTNLSLQFSNHLSNHKKQGAKGWTILMALIGSVIAILQVIILSKLGVK